MPDDGTWLIAPDLISLGPPSVSTVSFALDDVDILAEKCQIVSLSSCFSLFVWVFLHFFVVVSCGRENSLSLSLKVVSMARRVRNGFLSASQNGALQ